MDVFALRCGYFMNYVIEFYVELKRIADCLNSSNSLDIVYLFIRLFIHLFTVQLLLSDHQLRDHKKAVAEEKGSPNAIK